VAEYRPILSAEYRLPLLVKTGPPLQRGLSAITELLVEYLEFDANTVVRPPDVCRGLSVLLLIFFFAKLEIA